MKQFTVDLRENRCRACKGLGILLVALDGDETNCAIQRCDACFGDNAVSTDSDAARLAYQLAIQAAETRAGGPLGIPHSSKVTFRE